MRSQESVIGKALRLMSTSVAVSVCAALVVAAAPSAAYAATNADPAASAKPAKKSKHVKSVHRAEKAAAADTKATPAAKPEKVAVMSRAERRRVHYRVGGHAAVMSKVAFEPRQSVGQTFGLHDTPDELALRSSVAYVVDQNTHEVLFDKNSQSVMPIASITKLMMAMVVLDSKAPLNEQIEVTDEDRDMIKNTGSRLSVGSVLSRDDMLHIALMASENRAAASLSRYYPGGRPAFIAAMNKKAESLGMTDTHFLSPSGLSSENVSTGRDLVRMVDAAYQYPLIRQYSTDVSYEVYTGRKTIHYGTTNALVRGGKWDIGLQKTGFINEAGECMVMQTTIQNRPIDIVLLDSSGKYSRFGDAQRIRTWIDAGGVQHVTSIDDTHGT
ncbi:D-alanyl-D-alanine endopeptidase [Pararobbsia silviterrae]|uniref:D-alanyl-D-alanine endopeptidase n=1 Tax=Pararobbsia silviterrae TaxID=1792498 RepID=A0A494X7H6_9BURK|nr:D-alanyl-D-alanine endopeptidase [Pararobbsia silviterrae]RKP44256.1 D-alanyl-D-alanine endopeptidase [Pararobbsia silviterrae]